MNRRLEITQTDQGFWTWTYSDADTTLSANRVYRRLADAVDSARHSYPGADVRVKNAESHSRSPRRVRGDASSGKAAPRGIFGWIAFVLALLRAKARSNS